MDTHELHERETVHLHIPKEIAAELRFIANTTGVNVSNCATEALRFALIWENAWKPDLWDSQDDPEKNPRVPARPENAFTISQAAETLGVTASWLRFGERLGSIPIAQRTRGGQRYYTPDDVAALRALGVGSGHR